MNYLDLILALPLVIGAIKGYDKGFILELASLVGVILGLVAATIFAQTIAGILGEFVSWDPDVIKIISFILLFIFVLVVTRLVGHVLQGVIKTMGIGPLNSFAGLGAGALKAALILSIVLVFFNYINRDKSFLSDETRNGSFLYNKIAELVPTFLPGIDLDDVEGIVVKVKNLGRD